MNLKYRILWFEDDPEVVEDKVRPILEPLLLGLGLELEISHHINGKYLETLIKDKNYDLIVTDLNLGEEETGDKIIDHIREGNILTEVLLYSASRADLEAVVERKGWIERASFTVGIKTLINKLKDVINLTVRKHQDVNNIRGLVIAETILLEKKIEKILIEYFEVAKGSILDEDKAEILASFKERTQKKFDEKVDFFTKINFSDIKELINNDILTASNCIDVIDGILKRRIKAINVKLSAGKLNSAKLGELTKAKDELTAIKPDIGSFRTEILKIRNTLAHVEEELSEDGFPILNSINSDGTKIKLDPQQYIKIRQDLHKHNRNLEKISEHIKSVTD